MMTVALFLLGAPGVGKTTLARALLAQCAPPTFVESPKWTLRGDVAAAGHYVGAAFDGGDSIPYNGAQAALAYWRDHVLPTNRLTIFDGDRFSSRASLAFVRELGVAVAGAHLVDDALATMRRAFRSTQTGATQNEAWVRGRATKARNFAALIGATDVAAGQSIDALVRRVGEIVHLGGARGCST